MRIYIIAITFAATIGGLFLYENYQVPAQEQNYAKIISELQQTVTPTPGTQPTKTIVSTGQPANKSSTAPVAKPTPTLSSPSPIGSGSPQPSPNATADTAASSPSTTPTAHIYYTSSSASAKYYYCDTDSGWKNLSKANLKQFPSPEELLKSYPDRTLHEPCK